MHSRCTRQRRRACALSPTAMDHNPQANTCTARPQPPRPRSCRWGTTAHYVCAAQSLLLPPSQRCLLGTDPSVQLISSAHRPQLQPCIMHSPAHSFMHMLPPPRTPRAHQSRCGHTGAQAAGTAPGHPSSWLGTPGRVDSGSSVNIGSSSVGED